MSHFVEDQITKLQWCVGERAGNVTEAQEWLLQLNVKAKASGKIWRLPTEREALDAIRGEAEDFHRFVFDKSAVSDEKKEEEEAKAEDDDATSDSIRGVWLADQTAFKLDSRAQESPTKVLEPLRFVAVSDLLVASTGTNARPSAVGKKWLTISGYLDKPEYQQCAEMAEYLNKEHSDEYQIAVEKMFAFQYEVKRRTLLANGTAAGDAFEDLSTADVLVVDYQGNAESPSILSGKQFLKRICATTDFKLFDLPDDHPQSYRSLAQRNFVSFLSQTGSEYCWMKVRIGESFVGRVVFQLYGSLCPRTCENFVHLCRGDLKDVEVVGSNPPKKIALSYKGSTFFRVVRGGWIQAGDITGSGGNGGYSIYGPTFPDECFNVKHDEAGIVGMANDGEHTNKSQFYVTLQKSCWMDGKYVAFGRVVEGMGTVQAIGEIETYHNQTPKTKIVIEDCGHIPLQA